MMKKAEYAEERPVFCEVMPDEQVTVREDDYLVTLTSGAYPCEIIKSIYATDVKYRVDFNRPRVKFTYLIWSVFQKNGRETVKPSAFVNFDDGSFKFYEGEIYMFVKRPPTEAFGELAEQGSLF